MTHSLTSRRSLAAGLILSASFSTLPAQEWSQFRGPGGQGIGAADTLPAKLTESHIRWRALVGRGHSSPITFGDRIYLTRMGEKDGTRELICLDKDNGKELWAYTDRFESHRQHRLNSFASATPVADAAGIYIYWTSGTDLVALAVDHAGKKRWSRTLGSFAAQHGSGASPILHGKQLIIANENEGDDSFLTALDKDTGKPIWRIDRESSARRGSYCCPVVYQQEDQDPLLLFASQPHGLTAVDPKAGKVRWELPLEFRQRCVATPCLHDELVFISTGAGGSGRESAFVALPKDASAKPKVAHRMRRSIPYVPCAIVVDKHFYMFNDGGVASCLSAESGESVWRERMDGSFFSSPVSNGKTIYIADREGRLHMLVPGKKLATHPPLDLGGPVNATPAIAHDTLYVRTDRELLALRGAAPKKSRKLK